MIGKAYVCTFPFYDMKQGKMSYKNRPVLIIGKADLSDYVVLPISRVTQRHRLVPEYDLEITANLFPRMNMKQTSYIRTHKQQIANSAELSYEIADFRKEYPETFSIVLKKVEQFQSQMLQDARS